MSGEPKKDDPKISKAPTGNPSVVPPAEVVARSETGGQNLLEDVPFDAGALAADPVKPYFAVLTADCPVPYVSFGPVTFHKKIERRDESDNVISLAGQVLFLTDEQIRLCKEDMGCYVLRVFYETDGHRRKRVGQQKIAHSRWERPGVGQNGSALVGTDGKPIEKARLVRNAASMYTPHRNDLPWSKFCLLEPISAENLRILSMVRGEGDNLVLQAQLERDESGQIAPPRDLLAAAREFNAVESEKEQSLGAEAGIARGKRRGTTMGRED